MDYSKSKLKKILIIEDDVKLLDEIHDLLSSLKKYDIVKTSRGEIGYSQILNFKPNLLILDVMLPEMDGFEICRLIKELPFESRPVIILLTALSSVLNKMESDWLSQTGAQALLTKPLDRNQLLSLIDKFLSPRL
ncbi:MAG: response regulator [Candidatus Aureabacteria bacterium]|nr:response regulator [Candidatus Auribacterota bacterium]